MDGKGEGDGWGVAVLDDSEDTTAQPFLESSLLHIVCCSMIDNRHPFVSPGFVLHLVN